MGSSAGAGSGEFHVYRHLRRKEYSRQKFIQEKGQKVGFIITLHIFLNLNSSGNYINMQGRMCIVHSVWFSFTGQGSLTYLFIKWDVLIAK